MAAILRGKFILFCVLLCFFINPGVAPSTTQPAFVITTSQSKCSLDEDIQCKNVPQYCANCTFNSSCIYGQLTTINCTALESVRCWVIVAKSSKSYFVLHLRCHYELHVLTAKIQSPNGIVCSARGHTEEHGSPHEIVTFENHLHVWK